MTLITIQFCIAGAALVLGIWISVSNTWQDGLWSLVAAVLLALIAGSQFTRIRRARTQHSEQGPPA